MANLSLTLAAASIECAHMNCLSVSYSQDLKLCTPIVERIAIVVNAYLYCDVMVVCAVQYFTVYYK